MKLTIWGDELASWVAAAVLSQYGNTVCFASDKYTRVGEIDKLSLTSEPGLVSLLEEQEENGRLRVVTPAEGLSYSNIHWFGFLPAEYQQAEDIVESLADIHPEQLLVINQSNFGVGSTARLQEALKNPDQSVAYHPDNIPQGDAVRYFRSPKTLIVGCEGDWAKLQIESLLRPFCSSVENFILLTPSEAEFTKFAVTGMLALRLGYINELANLADHLGVDIEPVRNAMTTDPRVGSHFLEPGCGFGGQQFYRYIEGLADILTEKHDSTFLSMVLSENEQQKELPFRKLWEYYNCDLSGKTVSIWGLSFKPQTASIDNAPSIRIIEALLAQSVNIRAHDPKAMDNMRRLFGDNPQITYAEDPYDALVDSDALIVSTAWNEYWSPDFERIAELMRDPLIIDGRNMFDKNMVQSTGFTYRGVGR